MAPAPQVGSVVAYRDGQATLFGALRPAPAGHVYEAWVLPRGQSVPIAAGTFRGGRGLSFTLTIPPPPATPSSSRSSPATAARRRRARP